MNWTFLLALSYIRLYDNLHYCWLLQYVLYAEGTRFTPAKHKASVQFCEARGIEPFRNVLCPRTKGTVEVISQLGDSCECNVNSSLCYYLGKRPNQNSFQNTNVHFLIAALYRTSTRAILSDCGLIIIIIWYLYRQLNWLKSVIDVKLDLISNLIKLFCNGNHNIILDLQNNRCWGHFSDCIKKVRKNFLPKRTKINTVSSY